jgi:glycosyltransferase involved in cell wall biosynthesis
MKEVSARPLVSVVVPVYNAARYLTPALESVRRQTLADFELIAVDDGSTDASPGMLAALAKTEPRLRVVSRPNTGIVGALNDGLALARGEFVARMDADDLCLPERFARQVAYLRQHPDCVAVGSAFRYIDSSGGHLKECVRTSEHDAIERELLGGNGGILIHPATLFRRAAIEQVGRYRELAQWVEDLDLYLRLARVGRLANLPDVLLHYRLHEQSVNFTRHQGRHARTLTVLAEAHDVRGLPFAPSAHPAPAPLALGADDFRDFAITGLRFGPHGRPWYYAWRALRAEPGRLSSWRTAWYVAKHLAGLLPR